MIGAPEVLIVDDDGDVREALTMLLQSAGMATRSFAAADAFLEASPPSGPACVLLDLRMPEMDGFAVQHLLRKQRTAPPIIFLTGHGDIDAAVQALKNGALDFFQKPGFDPDALIQRVFDAWRQHAETLWLERQRQALRARLERLSPREHEVLRHVVAGEANKVIGIELAISERTVEVHRGRVMRKLGVRSLAELIRMMDSH